MIQKFKYYLHDNREYDEVREALENKIELSEKAWDNLCDSRFAYEVGFWCEVDEKGNVKITGLVNGKD